MNTDAMDTLRSAIEKCGLVSQGEMYQEKAYTAVQTVIEGKTAQVGYNPTTKYFRIRVPQTCVCIGDRMDGVVRMVTRNLRKQNHE